MTTELDLKFQPKVWAAIQRYGIDATFFTYPAKVIDKSTSTVSLGAATTYTVKITPPEMKQKLAYTPLANERTSGGIPGSDEYSERFDTFLASGAGESPIGFVPEVGMRVDFNSTSWRILQVTSVQPGDDVIGWDLILAQ